MATIKAQYRINKTELDRIGFKEAELRAKHELTRIVASEIATKHPELFHKTHEPMGNIVFTCAVELVIDGTYEAMLRDYEQLRHALWRTQEELKSVNFSYRALRQEAEEAKGEDE